MREYLKRVVTYCPSIEGKVNQEVSFRGVNGKKEFSATCTGIRDSCYDCFIVQSANNKMYCQD
ncbi:hypothetical protein F9802_11950 [Bacillus aerolatus]|uniref:Uncharacterized protein n=1 Tax=Bacillus aerolatus TaxID=2653354 RepID=A0A6I1FPR1_9BACI|nr:hypothetical protein [Bacillus aerolatus]KAB7706280.1 hypothetical protein F9802_11950 [Bacillus aerolatus]